MPDVGLQQCSYYAKLCVTAISRNYSKIV